MTHFSVRTDRDGQTTVLHLAGELDLATVGEMRDAAYAELDRGECTTLAFDLAELEFLDSTGIGSWVEIRGRAVDNGKRVVIQAAPEFVQRVLEIGALTKLFPEVEQKS